MNYELRVYPNPTRGKIVVSGQWSVVSVEIYDVVGKKHESRISEIGQSDIVLDISHLPNGVYFIKIITDKGELTKKIIKE